LKEIFGEERERKRVKMPGGGWLSLRVRRW